MLPLSNISKHRLSVNKIEVFFPTFVLLVLPALHFSFLLKVRQQACCILIFSFELIKERIKRKMITKNYRFSEMKCLMSGICKYIFFKFVVYFSTLLIN